MSAGAASRPGRGRRVVGWAGLGAIACILAIVSIFKIMEWMAIAEEVEGGMHRLHPAEVAHQQALQAWLRAEQSRQEIQSRLMQPWAQAAATRREAAEAEQTGYAFKMRDAPQRCREELRIRMPEGWMVSGQSLGQSANVGWHGTWQVSGILTVVDETGARQRYHYQCDFAGAALAEIVIADPITRANPVSLYSAL